MADLQELIARRAYELFIEGGLTHGHDLEDWLQAESQLLTSATLEMVESAEAITVRSALPGFIARDIEIHAEPQRLFISGQRLEEKRGKSTQSEQRWKRIFNRLDLPAPIDPEKVRATFSNGELQIDLPKATSDQNVVAAAKAA